jgi:hypothetical protein
MEKKMVYELPTPFTYTSPTDHNDVSLPKIIQGKDLSYDCQTNKKGRHQRNLSQPNTHLREKRAIVTNHDTVEESNIKQSSFGRGPPKLVFAFPSRSN